MTVSMSSAAVPVPAARADVERPVLTPVRRQASPEPPSPADRQEAEQRRLVRTMKTQMRRINDKSEGSQWQLVQIVDAGVSRLERDFGTNRRQAYAQLSEQSPWKPTTLKKWVNVADTLRRHGLDEVMGSPTSSVHVISEIVGSGLDDAEKVELIRATYAYDGKHPSGRSTVAQVRAAIRERRPATSPLAQWRRNGDVWEFTSDQAEHLPAHAAMNVVARWVVAGAKVLVIAEEAAAVGAVIEEIDTSLDVRTIAPHDGVMAGTSGTLPSDLATASSPPNLCGDWRADLALLAVRVDLSAPTPDSDGTRRRLDLWSAAIKSARTALAPGGVIAVVTEPNSRIAAEAGPSLDIDYEVMALLRTEGLAAQFLGRVGVCVRAPAPARGRSGSERSRSCLRTIAVYRNRD